MARNKWGDCADAADFGIHPRHGELYERGWCAPHVSVTVASGIRAGEQILTWFAAQARSGAPDFFSAGKQIFPFTFQTQ